MSQKEASVVVVPFERFGKELDRIKPGEHFAAWADPFGRIFFWNWRDSYVSHDDMIFSLHEEGEIRVRNEGEALKKGWIRMVLNNWPSITLNEIVLDLFDLSKRRETVEGLLASLAANHPGANVTLHDSKVGKTFKLKVHDLTGVPTTARGILGRGGPEDVWEGFSVYANPYSEIEERIIVTNPEAPRVEGYEGMVVEYRPSTRKFPVRQFKDAGSVFHWARGLGLLDDVRERIYAIYLDVKNKPLGYRLLGVGGPAECLADPKVLYGPAVALHAVSVMILHNHPSGSLEPSNSDTALNERFKRAGELVNVRLLDSIIVSREGYNSLLHDTQPTKISMPLSVEHAAEGN